MGRNWIRIETLPEEVYSNGSWLGSFEVRRDEPVMGLRVPLDFAPRTISRMSPRFV
jgi:hypothetical protein